MRGLVAAGVLAGILVAFAAAAQTAKGGAPESGAPVAESMYQRGKDLMAAGKVAEACDALAESHRIDPATGGTLLNLAVCHEKLGRFATASAEFEEARALARHFHRPDREQFAAKHVASLRSRISALTISAPNAVVGETVVLDDVSLSKASWVNLPIDPGDHKLTANAPGKLPWSTTITIGTSRVEEEIEVPALVDAPPPPPPTAPAVAAEDGGRGKMRTYASLGLGGFGIAALGVGAVFGVAAIQQNSQSEQNCPAGRCNETGATDSQHALTDANVADVMIGTGLVAVGVATVLLLTGRGSSPPRSAAQASFFARPGSLGLEGAW